MSQSYSQEGFSCTVTSNGQVKCWGSGSYGQLGNGTSSPSNQPVTVAGINNAVKVFTASSSFSTSYGRACAILSTGQIKCWGYLPTYGTTYAPVIISGVSNAIDMAMSGDTGTGQGYYCAVLATGAIVCGGSGGYGQLGNSASSDVNWTTPVTVSGVTNAKKVYVSISGYSSPFAVSCAMLTDGSLKCWGYSGTTGQLGDGSTGVIKNIPTAQVGMKTSTGVALSETWSST